MMVTSAVFNTGSFRLSLIIQITSCLTRIRSTDSTGLRMCGVCTARLIRSSWADDMQIVLRKAWRARRRVGTQWRAMPRLPKEQLPTHSISHFPYTCFKLACTHISTSACSRRHLGRETWAMRRKGSSRLQDGSAETAQYLLGVQGTYCYGSAH